MRRAVHREAERIWGDWNTISSARKKVMYDWFRANTQSHHVAKMLKPELVETMAKLQKLDPQPTASFAQ